MDDFLDDCFLVSIDNRGHRSIEICIQEIRSRSSRTVENTLTNPVDGGVHGVASSFPDVVHGRVIGQSSAGGSRYVLSASTTVRTNDSSRRPWRRTIAACFGDATALLPAAGVTWRNIDELSARATLDDGDVTATAVFHFDEEGYLSRLTADWYRQNIDAVAPWTGQYRAHEARDGM